MKMEENNGQRKRELQKLVRQGYKLIHKEPQRALTFFKKAYKGARDLEDDKLERTCAFNLGALYIDLGKPKEGVEYLHKAIPPENEKDDKSNGDVYFNLGLGYEKPDMDQKKAINYYRKAADEYESERNSARQTECLEKILKLQRVPGNDDELLRAYDDLVKLLDKEEQFNKKMSFLCEKANFLRSKKKIKEAEQAADECLNIQEKVGESTDETTACTLNELGLLYTQIQQYDKATKCFEQALPIIRNCEGNPKLEAVILQNLGAAYNFVGDYQRSKTFHLQAADKFAKLRNRHSQGQCFANLAFAHSQLGDNDGAWEYFVLARQAAEDSGDVNTIWQVHEGLGSVQFNRGNMEKAEEYFKKALKELGNKNEDAFNRIVSKLKNVHELQIQLQIQEFSGTRRMPGSSFGLKSFGPQQRRGIQSGTLIQSRTDPNEPQPEDTGLRETILQPVSEPPPVIHENHFYREPGQRVIPVERDTDIPTHHQRVNRGFSFHSGDVTPAYLRRHQNLEEKVETTSDSDDTSDDSDSDSTKTESDDEPTERKEVSSVQSLPNYFPRKDREANMLRLPVHADEGTLGSMRHRYETLLEQKEGEEDDTEEKETTDSDTESGSDEETSREGEDEYHERGRHPNVPRELPPAGSLAVNTYENFEPRQQAKEHENSDSSSDDQGSQTGSGTYAEVDFSTKTSSRQAGNDDSKEFQRMPKSRNLSKVNFLSPSDEDDGQSSEQHETGNLSPHQGTSAERSHRISDSSEEYEEKHTPRGERDRRSYQLHRQMRENEARNQESKEEGKPSKTCILM
ncbi:hypothetical protein CHS0354_018953 [Potamilus streckersoni]|uniref:Uncharacterized protein n=1 Tax=Potamilus streckersoni TaxID=2493646 RepID=A0AAE0T763_9BIVA|nr:hypothetical protein CHS0354_018953 [Potamilus streckersoni]